MSRTHPPRGNSRLQHRQNVAAAPRRAGWLTLLCMTLVCVWLGLAGIAAAQDGKGPAPKITQEQATQIALKVVPGKVTDVAIERKRGRRVYVVEIVAEKDGAETDVLVDIESGKVLGTE